MHCSIELDARPLFRRVGPDGPAAVLRGFVLVAGEDVGVQGGVAVAKDLVVDPECVCALMERFSEERHVGQEDGTGCVVEISEMAHNRVGQQQRVTGEELMVSEHCPTRSHAADDGRILVSLGQVDPFVNQCWMVDHIASTDLQTPDILAVSKLTGAHREGEAVRFMVRLSPWTLPSQAVALRGADNRAPSECVSLERIEIRTTVSSLIRRRIQQRALRCERRYDSSYPMPFVP